MRPARRLLVLATWWTGQGRTALRVLPLPRCFALHFVSLVGSGAATHMREDHHARDMSGGFAAPSSMLPACCCCAAVDQATGHNTHPTIPSEPHGAHAHSAPRPHHVCVHPSQLGPHGQIYETRVRQDSERCRHATAAARVPRIPSSVDARRTFPHATHSRPSFAEKQRAVDLLETYYPLLYLPTLPVATAAAGELGSGVVAVWSAW